MMVVVPILLCALAQDAPKKVVVYDPPPITATMSPNRYDLTLPTPPPPEEKPLHEKWWFWAAVMGGATVAAGSVVLIATLTDPEGEIERRPDFDP